MSSETYYDDFLYPILYREGNIFEFFDKIFDFLYRRTDFFKFKDESSTLGLADGEAEKIVRTVFCKYMEKAVAEHRSQIISDVEPVPLDFVAEETVVTTSNPECDAVPLTPSIEECVDSKKAEIPVRREEDETDPKVPIMDPDSYNGACYDDYSWAQTIRDADIHIKVPANVTSGKQVRVNIQHAHVKVELMKNNEWSTLKEGDLSWRINVEESTWTLVPGEEIHICLQKIQERWWDSFFIGEPKINLRAIDPSIPYEDLDQESQAKIEELMYNEHLKRLGKPTIQQSKIQNILKDAWDRDGSPFKGQPFDPSVLDASSANGSI
ncbi:nudC domain-containing protein 3-like [Argiope bruennichi]|uniref:NudC domain-containing protein 3 n=1 Tax=Argiope bruennichi TaxID=94029 RepID=A0A8T0FDC9_ARGBR|nr:nudC domain-containing protein 3-like [Argiope bruennichi]XP_055941384.1 nudC domain-containing protein 3-like [Argiope bruennichi]KAF8786923.1 NudC domain-containing protein 3 [Argiope bruennichi]